MPARCIASGRYRWFLDLLILPGDGVHRLLLQIRRNPTHCEHVERARPPTGAGRQLAVRCHVACSFPKRKRRGPAVQLDAAVNPDGATGCLLAHFLYTTDDLGERRRNVACRRSRAWAGAVRHLHGLESAVQAFDRYEFASSLFAGAASRGVPGRQASARRAPCHCLQQLAHAPMWTRISDGQYGAFCVTSGPDVCCLCWGSPWWSRSPSGRRRRGTRPSPRVASSICNAEGARPSEAAGGGTRGHDVPNSR